VAGVWLSHQRLRYPGSATWLTPSCLVLTVTSAGIRRVSSFGDPGPVTVLVFRPDLSSPGRETRSPVCEYERPAGACRENRTGPGDSAGRGAGPVSPG
jgi:hypothetical protein